MEVGADTFRCDDCESSSILLPPLLHDDTEVLCAGCGESLGTVRKLRKLIEAALGDDPHAYSDNDN